MIDILCDVVIVFSIFTGAAMWAVGEAHAAWGCLICAIGWNIVRLLRAKVRT